MEEGQIQAIVGEGGAKLAEDALLACIPGACGPLWSLAACLDRIVAVGAGPLCQLSAVARTKQSTLHEVVHAMLRGQAQEEEDWKDSEFLTKASWV